MRGKAAPSLERFLLQRATHAAIFLHRPDANVFDVEEFLDTVSRPLPADARILDAAERRHLG